MSGNQTRKGPGILPRAVGLLGLGLGVNALTHNQQVNVRNWRSSALAGRAAGKGSRKLYAPLNLSGAPSPAATLAAMPSAVAVPTVRAVAMEGVSVVNQVKTEGATPSAKAEVAKLVSATMAATATPSPSATPAEIAIVEQARQALIEVVEQARPILPEPVPEEFRLYNFVPPPQVQQIPVVPAAGRVQIPQFVGNPNSWTGRTYFMILGTILVVGALATVIVGSGGIAAPVAGPVAAGALVPAAEMAVAAGVVEAVAVAAAPAAGAITAAAAVPAAAAAVPAGAAAAAAAAAGAGIAFTMEEAATAAFMAAMGAMQGGKKNRKSMRKRAKRRGSRRA